MERRLSRFIWDTEREMANIEKHGIDFTVASRAFLDIKRKIVVDSKHSIVELRHYCIGNVEGKIITVRFTYRRGKIRIFGAGYWRKGKMHYEED
jgi:Uncharacterized protein conserved in bacteria